MRFKGVRGGNAVLASSRIFTRTGLMYLRGILSRPWFGHSGGPLYRGRGVSLYNARFISYSGRLVLEDYVELQGVSENGIQFGDSVSIGRGAMIRPSSYYGGDAGLGMRIGSRSSVGAGSFIGCSGWIEIGDDVLVGPGVRLFSENHTITDTVKSIKSQGVTRGALIIEDDCWIGSGATILSNVRVGRGSVIAAGCVVTKDVPPYSVVAGVPGRVIRSRERS
ncbi:acyltransferase [Salinibacterium sp. G-O1]|uniref:acyltransferase n=1 Tax=Salinibacterium sp. G-O1 TaxID=3046208 RepID=UPI0032D9A089